MELPVVVVAVAPQPRSTERGQVGSRGHGPRVVSAVVSAGRGVERVPPVQAGREDDGRSALRLEHHGGGGGGGLLAAGSGRQDVVDAEHAGRHPTPLG